MVPAYNTREMENANTRLDKVVSGAAASGLELSESMKTEIASMQQQLQENVAQYRLARRQDQQARLTLLATQEDTVLLLRRIRQIVGAHLPQEERLAIRRQYGLTRIPGNSRERLLQVVSNIKAVSDGLQAAPLKLAKQEVASAKSLAQALQEGLETRRHLRAQMISLRQVRVEVIIQFRQLRTRIYAFLMTVMPAGSRDPRLLEFGFRPSSLRRSGAQAEIEVEAEAENVTVVNEEPEVVSTPVTASVV